jgi:uncharacterized phage-associated protein
VAVPDDRVLSAHDVADVLREMVPSIGVVKLHKLLYYAQGWHLARTGSPLFGERVEAWANGPVVASLWADEKHGRGRPVPRQMADEQRITLEFVVREYGGATGKALIRMAHAEDPWRDASEQDDADAMASANPEITHGALRAWFYESEAHQRYLGEVERLRSRTDVHGFERLSPAWDVDAVVAEVLAGPAQDDPRPA